LQDIGLGDGGRHLAACFLAAELIAS
jgi:hypothetical protein